MKTKIGNKEKPRNKSQKNTIKQNLQTNQTKPNKTHKQIRQTDKPEVAARNRQRRRARELWLGRKRQRDAS